jgi:hypothetical protein
VVPVTEPFELFPLGTQERSMAADEEDVEDVASSGTDEQDGSGGEDTAGEDVGGGDEAGEVSAERSDASPEGDLGPQGLEQAEGDVEPPSRPSRGSERIARLANENRDLRDRYARMEAALQERQRLEYQRQQEYERQVEQERLSLMPPEERAGYEVQRLRNEMARQRQQDVLFLQNQFDRMNFEAKATVNSTYAKYKDDVERIFQDRLQRGQAAPREDILKWLIGERSLAQATKSTARGRATGAKRIAAHTTAPGKPKGDAASNRERSGSSAAKRLEGVEI